MLYCTPPGLIQPTPLRRLRLVKDQGSLITIDSLSFDFEERHGKPPFSSGKHNVKALFFIVEASGPQLEKVTRGIDLKHLRTFVAQSFP